MDEAERQPGALISILQTTTHGGLLLSASATVCSLFVQLTVSTVLLNSCAGVFCSSRDEHENIVSGEMQGLKELWVMSWKTALIMLTVTRWTDVSVSGSVNKV